MPFNPVDSTTNGLLLAVLKQVLFPTAKASADKTASYYTGWGAGDALGFLGNILPLDQDSLTNGLEQLGAFSVTDNNVELVFVCESFAVDKSDGTRVAQATFCSTYVDTSGDTPGAYDISLTWHVEDPSTAYVIASCRYSAPQPLPLNGN